MYASLSDVRIFAGIVGNLDISTASIETKLDMANSIINGKIYDVYTLPLAEVPSLILNFSAELAAAFVLSDEYGVETDGTDKDSETRIDRVMGFLEQVQKRKLKIISDTTGLELALASRTQPNAVASDTTEVAQDSSSTASKFGMNQVF